MIESNESKGNQRGQKIKGVNQVVLTPLIFDYAWAGDADSAFASLEKGLALGSSLGGVDSDPFLASLHDDPRWQPWLEKAGRSPEQLAAIKFKVSLPN